MESGYLPQGPVKKRATPQRVGFSVILVILGIAAMFVLMEYKPLNSYEAFLVAAFWTAPLWVGFNMLLYYTLKPEQPSTPVASNPMVSRRPSNMNISLSIYAVLGSVFCIPTAYLYLNAMLDNSPEETRVLTITGRDYHTNKHSVTYYATTPVFMPSPLSQLGFGDEPLLDHKEYFTINKAFYDRLQQGKDKVQLSIRKGYFNLPWVAHEQWLEEPRAITAGSSLYWKGVAYEFGRGVVKDNAQALHYYQLSAESGDPEGQHALAYHYSTGGLGLKQDWVVANQWLMKAALQGNAVAQDDLGVSYGDGRGIEQDWIKSYMWIDLAAKQGNAQALQDREFAKAHMTPAQIEQAQRLSAAWRPTQW